MVVSLSCCVLLRMPTAFATTIYEYPKCEDFFRSKTASAAPWVYENVIYHYYDFHLLSIAQTVFPFFVLLTFNVVSNVKVVTWYSSFPPIKYKKSACDGQFDKEAARSIWQVSNVGPAGSVPLGQKIFI